MPEGQFEFLFGVQNTKAPSIQNEYNHIYPVCQVVRNKIVSKRNLFVPGFCRIEITEFFAGKIISTKRFVLVQKEGLFFFIVVGHKGNKI